MLFSHEGKIEHYIKIIDTYRIASFFPVKKAKFCKKAKQIFKPPSHEIPDAEWEEFDSTKILDFGITKDDWFAFQGEIIFPQQNLTFFMMDIFIFKI